MSIRAVRRILPLFVALLCASVLWAGEDAQTITLKPEEIPQPFVRWYGVYGPNNAKIGYGRMEFCGKKSDAYQTSMHLVMKIAGMGKTMDMEMDESRRYSITPPYGLLGANTLMIRNGQSMGISLDQKDDGFVATIKQEGAERQIPVQKTSETLSDNLTGDTWVRRKPRTVGESIKSTQLGLQKLENDVQTYTILSANEAIVGGAKVNFYEIKGSSEKAGEVGTMRVDSNGTLLSMKLGGMMELRLETEELAKKIDYSSDLFVFGIAQIDKPLGDPKKVLRMSVEATGENVGKLTSASQQTVVPGEKAGTCLLKLGTGNATPEKCRAEDIENYSRETPAYPINDADVKALAQQACGDAKDPREKVKRLVKFVYGFLGKEIVMGNFSVKEIIAAKKGQCTHHAMLFTALARASGVPARQVSGLMYMGDKAKSFGGHAWSEVALDGVWVPVDPTWNETELDGSHIRFAADRDASVMFLLGQVKLKLVELEQSK